jgi:tripeptide aminopeptidase
MEIPMLDVLERFLRYVKIDTRSDPSSEQDPSTEKQWNLARLLVEEMKEIGLQDIEVNPQAVVTARLPGNKSCEAPVIGFIAHMDTSPETSGADVQPQLLKNYDGGDIMLNSNEGVVLSLKDFPELSQYKGQTLITTDGTTLLGADDKAGVAEIMAAMAHLAAHPEIEHGEIRVAFTPDEEIGRGTENFDVKAFGADFAYTLDGGEIGELEYENFNAAGVKIKIKGRNVHPGTAKDKMKNAISIGMQLAAMLPANERPEHTTGYEGFFHLMDMKGTVEEASLTYILRDHDRARFEDRKETLKLAASFLNGKYGDGTVSLEMRDQYFNMKEHILPVIHIVEMAKQAMLDVGVQPIVKPIRGGTDGAKLSAMGLPTPNLFTGGHNFHGRYEYIPLESMEKAVEMVVRIAELAVG